MSRYVTTYHAKERIRERFDFAKGTEINKLFAKAIKSGKSPSDLEEPFASFCRSKLSRGAQIKVYNGMIFIYKGKKLITSYKVPDKYQIQINVDKEKKYYNIEVHDLTNKKLKQRLLDEIQDLIVAMYNPQYNIDEITMLWVHCTVLMKILKGRVKDTSCDVDIKVHRYNTVPLLYIYSSVLRTSLRGITGFGNTKEMTKGEKRACRHGTYTSIQVINNCLDVIYHQIVHVQLHSYK